MQEVPSTRVASTIRPGDAVSLVDDAGDTYLVTAQEGPGHMERIKGIGVLDLGKLSGLAWGSRFEHGTKTFTPFTPSTADLLAALPRKAQVILPKDAARIILECDIRAGQHVVESGIGSAHLTAALGRAVLPDGRVSTYEIREDFLAWGKGNVERARLASVVDAKLGDVTQGISERNVDAVVLDIPNPWDAVLHARDALRPGGYLASYSPLVTQVEDTHRAIRESGGFATPWTIETLERRWVVGPRGSRPDFGMLGHTAFLTFARRSGATSEPVS